jgi:hypothetical protein
VTLAAEVSFRQARSCFAQRTRKARASRHEWSVKTRVNRGQKTLRQGQFVYVVDSIEK